MRYKVFYSSLLSIFFLFFCNYVFSQSKSDLETKKRDNIEKIKLSRQLLEKTREKKKNSVYQINLLDQRIEYRNNLLENYSKEIEEIEKQHYIAENQIEENAAILDDLKRQYAKIVKNSYRNIDDEYLWMYILSSEDINQGYERIRYIKYINEYRKNLYNDIQAKNDSLSELQNKLDTLKRDKQNIIQSLKNENARLYKDKREKRVSIDELKGQEKALLREIREREETQRKIENEIRRIIAEEARRAREENKIYELTPAEIIISDDFTSNRGGLPWPAMQGVVTGEFGEHPHPVIPGIRIRSNGIDLSTVENTEVRAIFKGEVTVVSAILGANYTVIIKHGNYRSVYQNLVNVNVKSGDLVETKEVIGVVGTNMDNETLLHFELWNGMDVENPRNWLSK